MDSKTSPLHRNFILIHKTHIFTYPPPIEQTQKNIVNKLLPHQKKQQKPPMFQYTEKVLSPKTFHFQIQQEGHTLTVQEVINLWQESTTFRAFYNKILEEVPFMGFFWENKPISRATLSEEYEFVVIGTEAFNGLQTNQKPFEQYFEEEELVVNFENLGKNAVLVVPCPSPLYTEGYKHLGQFIRNAPSAQWDALWKMVGEKVQAHVEGNQLPVWLSTSGLGVHWLHVRLDEQPKYYVHKAYKSLN